WGREPLPSGYMSPHMFLPDGDDLVALFVAPSPVLINYFAFSTIRPSATPPSHSRSQSLILRSRSVVAPFTFSRACQPRRSSLYSRQRKSAPYLRLSSISSLSGFD